MDPNPWLGSVPSEMTIWLHDSNAGGGNDDDVNNDADDDDNTDCIEDGNDIDGLLLDDDDDDCNAGTSNTSLTLLIVLIVLIMMNSTNEMNILNTTIEQQMSRNVGWRLIVERLLYDNNCFSSGSTDGTCVNDAMRWFFSF